jgi:hypothetical protein
MIGIGTPNSHSRIPRPMISSYVQFRLTGQYDSNSNYP